MDKEKIEIFKKLKDETPAFVYFESEIKDAIQRLKSYQAPFGLTVRFAMKANPNLSLLRLFDLHNVWIDASTPNECYRAIAAGISAEHILLTSQESPDSKTLKELVQKGVEYNACSLRQLENYGKLFPGTELSVRFNAGRGSSYKCETATGGKGSSFGIYGNRAKIKSILEKYNLTLKRVHIHIGSEAYKEAQQESMIDAIEILKEFPTAYVLNMGGGFKIARMPDEDETDIVDLSEPGSELLENFCKKSGRNIKLEIEPGTALIANAGYIVTKITDLVNTGEDVDSMNFIKVDSGMTMNTRIAMHAGQHPIYHIPSEARQGERQSQRECLEVEDIASSVEKKVDCAVVGECCESSDILACMPGEPHKMREIEFNNPQVDDLLVVGGTGAYCAGMSITNYNSKQQAT